MKLIRSNAMKFSKTLHSLLEKDPKIVKIFEFVIIDIYHNQNHTQTRIKQSVINVNMI